MMKLKPLLYCVIITVLLANNYIIAQNDSIKRHNNLYFIFSFNGLGLGYELNPINRIYFEAGGTSWYVTNRVYLQRKYSLIDRRKLKLKFGADLSYINTNFFQIFEIIRISPLLNFNYNKWGLQFAMREPFWINYNDPFRPNIKQIKQQFIIIGITYNITMALESNRIRKCKKSRQ